MPIFKKSPDEKNKTRPAAPGRNDPCHCGSGKKYKKCCESKDESAEHQKLEKQWTAAEKEAAKAAEELKKSADASAAADASQNNPNHKPDQKSQVSGPRHNTLAAPKFNTPRRTGGG